MEERQEIIHKKGFNMMNDYSIRVGGKKLDDVVLNVQYRSSEQASENYRVRNVTKGRILKALRENDVNELRALSNLFYRTDGTYQKFCNYAATLYRYDWYVEGDTKGNENLNKKKVLSDFRNVLSYLDESHIKKTCSDISLAVIKDGAYYGYKVDCGDSVQLQQLPIKYCRCRFYKKNMPIVEFNMKFFDDKFPDLTTRQQVLKMFPPEFEKGYHLYHQHKLPADSILSSYGSYYTLQPGFGVKFSLTDSTGGDDLPLFINSLPAIMDLQMAQDIDRAKQLQQLKKVFIQKIPLDKNGDLIFDVDEAKDIHKNAVEMLSGAPGIEVLTTFTDVQVEDLADSDSSSGANDTLERAERTVYNAGGVSHNLFNTEGQTALEKSILVDEAQLRTLILQYHIFFDNVIKEKFPKREKYQFRFYMLETTQNNYQALSKTFKEQTQLGQSKILPQIALGISQSAILNAAIFENELLELSTIMIPPLMSSTMNSADVLGEKKEAGRPEKEDSEKSAKTIQNLESAS